MKKKSKRKQEEKKKTVSDGANWRHIALKLLRAGHVLCFVLLFLATLGAPLYESKMGGLSGSRAVVRTSFVLGLLAAAECWLRSTDPAARTDSNIESQEPDIWGSAWPKFVLLCAFLLCLNMFVLNMRSPKGWGLVTGNDQPQYYSYLHSWVFDRDLDFENEYQMMPGIWEMMKVGHPDDHTINVAPVGTPILWMPFYLASHVGVWLLRLAGADVAADGISSPYAAGVAFGSIFMAWLGMLMVYSTLREWFSERSALFSTLLLWLASPILWYLTDEVWMSHACSFFSAALVFWLWEKYRSDRSPVAWAVWGVAIGLAMLVRPSHVVLLALPVADAILRIRDGKPTGQSLAMLGLCTAGTLLAFVPQLAVWWLRSGVQVPPGNPMLWFRPAIVQVLFSAHHGLFAWHPVTLLGYVGLIFVWKRSRRVTICVGIVLLGATYLNAAIEAWSAGAAFGMRRFVGLLPFMAPGLAAFGSWLVRVFQRTPSVPVAVGVLALFLYNNLLAIQFREHWIHPVEPVSFQAIWRTEATLFHESFGNPFSYPANLWFAAKHGVSPAQYDVVNGALPKKDRTLVAEGPRLRYYLGAGWQKSSALSFKSDATFMAVQRRCSLLLPLRAGQAYHVEMGLALPKDIGENPSVTLSLNGQQIGAAALSTERTMNVKVTLDKNHTKDGVNVLELTFSRIKSQPWPDRTAAQGGTGLPAKKNRSLTAAAFLSKLAVTPVSTGT